MQGFHAISLADSTDSLPNHWDCICQKWFWSRGDPIQAKTIFVSDFWGSYSSITQRTQALLTKKHFSCTFLIKCLGQIEAMGHRIISCVCQTIGFDWSTTIDYWLFMGGGSPHFQLSFVFWSKTNVIVKSIWASISGTSCYFGQTPSSRGKA